MPKVLMTLMMAVLVQLSFPQVRIGANVSQVNPGAVLELSNDTSKAPVTWGSFVPPKVNFSNPVFSSNTIWGIAGTPTPGAIVYNVGETYSNGFSGQGLYCWQRNTWAPVSIQVIDKLRQSLNTSIAAYDAATVNSWVNVTAAEYNNLLVAVAGAAKYATPEIYMNTSSSGGWSAGYTIAGGNNVAKVPASQYVIGWSIRTGSGVSSALNSKLKLSESQNAGFVDYGSALPAIGNIPANTRVYFVLKLPYVVTPAAPSFTAVFNANTYFLGNTANAGAGPEYYVFGDGPNPTLVFNSDSYSQIISTPTRQW